MIRPFTLRSSTGEISDESFGSMGLAHGTDRFFDVRSDGDVMSGTVNSLGRSAELIESSRRSKPSSCEWIQSRKGGTNAGFRTVLGG
jgi:hypothetical protein